MRCSICQDTGRYYEGGYGNRDCSCEAGQALTEERHARWAKEDAERLAKAQASNVIRLEKWLKTKNSPGKV